MAKMIPRTPNPETRSRAELRFFDRVRDELPRPWYGMHSVGLANHDKKPWGEVDFVLVGKPGIICVEVKGGGVTRRGGEWIFHNAGGTQGRKREGPFEQAKSASFVLRDWLVSHDKRFEHALHAWCVVFPDTLFTVKGPDILEEVVVDERNWDEPLDVTLAKVTAYWEARLGRTRFVNPLDVDGIRRAVELVRGDFETSATPQRAIRDARERLLELTDAQRQTLQLLRTNPRMVVTGGAGTGKTVLAIDDVERLAAAGEAVLFCCFNRRLASHVEDVLRKRGVDVPSRVAGPAAGGTVRVATFHSLCGQLVGWHGVVADDYDRLVEDALGTAFQLGEPFTAVVVDEGQDLCSDAVLDVLEALLHGGLSNGTWRWFTDPNQDVFLRSDESAMPRLEDPRPARFHLDLNCRNTVPVARMAYQLSGIDVATKGTDGPEPELLQYVDEADAKRQTIQFLRRRMGEGAKPEDVKVLSTPAARGLVGDGKVVGDTGLVFTRAGSSTDLGPRDIEHCNVGSFKGLEADTVLLLTAHADFGGVSGQNVYVGASRPTVCLAVLVPAGVDVGRTASSVVARATPNPTAIGKRTGDVAGCSCL